MQNSVILTAATESVGGMSALPALIIPLLIGGVIALTLYFIPTIIAFKRRHLNRVPILLLDLFLGWSFIGWIIALIWSTTQNTENNQHI